MKGFEIKMAVVLFKPRNANGTIAHKTIEIYLLDNEDREIFYRRVLLNEKTIEVLMPDDAQYRCYILQKKLLYNGEVSRGTYRVDLAFPDITKNRIKRQKQKQTNAEAKQIILKQK